MLFEFLKKNRSELVRRAKVKVSARSAPRATEGELELGVPLFLDQLVEILRAEASDEPSAEGEDIGRSAARHGRDLLRRGFTIAQVVHDYGDICQAVTELADDLGVAISVDEFHTFNRCLDDAIASAVSEYGNKLGELTSHREVERLGFLAHELRNQLGAIALSFRMLRKGTVGVGGSTGAVVERTLASMGRLIDRSLAEVRLDTGIESTERLRVAEIIEDVEVWAAMDAEARKLQLIVSPVTYDLFVDGDRQLLSSALTNLVQNAFKFTREGGTVTLTVRNADGRVLLEVEDECGGLPAGSAETLFRPFAQRGTDRSGLGLGLAIAAKTVKAAGGEIRVRDLPGKGCIFTIDLPPSSEARLEPSATH